MGRENEKPAVRTIDDAAITFFSPQDSHLDDKGRPCQSKILFYYALLCFIDLYGYVVGREKVVQYLFAFFRPTLLTRGRRLPNF